MLTQPSKEAMEEAEKLYDHVLSSACNDDECHGEGHHEEFTLNGTTYLRHKRFGIENLALALDQAKAEGAERANEELAGVLYALGLMWNQYCGDGKSHMFMTAGERAEAALQSFGIKVDGVKGTDVPWEEDDYMKIVTARSALQTAKGEALVEERGKE